MNTHTDYCHPESLVTETVYAWPDLSWAYPDGLEQALQYMSDDYVKLTVRYPDDFDADEADDAITFAVGTYFGK